MGIIVTLCKQFTLIIFHLHVAPALTNNLRISVHMSLHVYEYIFVRVHMCVRACICVCQVKEK